MEEDCSETLREIKQSSSRLHKSHPVVVVVVTVVPVIVVVVAVLVGCYGIEKIPNTVIEKKYR